MLFLNGSAISEINSKIQEQFERVEEKFGGETENSGIIL
jgi:hypothetical protein